MNSHLKKIDIIIPIYNGYEDLKKCMTSIFLYTDLEEHRVILIDDKSTDDRIASLLEEYKKSNSNIVVIYNQENQGFSANINKGMEYSERDVILLNSDTIVTKGWINKIVSCAYQKKEIGTVTPLSNAATLCSVPVMCTDNELPKGINVDKMGEIVERHSLRKYPCITVAVGFCMYIKREVIDKVGKFDVESFGKGYGEENDFCNRAEQYGYIHVMCDDTFIYHKGTASFKTEEKMKLCAEHNKILEERYPEQMRKNHLYCMNNPDQYIRDNLNMYLKLQNGKKNIMYFIHSDFREDAGDNKGGTQFHVRDLVNSLKKQYNIFVMARDGENIFVTIYYEDEIEQLRFQIGEKSTFQKKFDKKLEHIIENVINAFEISIIHVHHTFSLSLDIYYVAKKHNIPLIATLHDYYYICPTIKLMNKDGDCCHEKISTPEDCIECLAIQCGYSKKVNIINDWRKDNEKALLMCDVIVVPSESAKKIIVRYFPALKSKVTVIEHGENLVKNVPEENVKNLIEGIPIQGSIDYCMNHPRQINTISGWGYIEGVNSSQVEIYLKFKSADGKIFIRKTERNKRDDVATQGKKYLLSGFIFHMAGTPLAEGKTTVSIIMKYEGRYFETGIKKHFDYKSNKLKQKKLNVAFLGAGTKEKGSRLINELVSDNSLKDVGFYLIGPIGDNKIKKINQENFVTIGTYDKEKIAKIMEYYQIDIICILPIWAETFCYTLSEAILCHIPVIGTDVGAVGERIRKLNCGWIVSVTDAVKEVKDILLKIMNDSSLLEEKRKMISNIELKTLEKMALEYVDIYEDMSGRKCEYGNPMSRVIFQARESVSKVVTSTPIQVQMLGVDNFSMKQKVKGKIKSTKIYKIMRKIKKAL